LPGDDRADGARPPRARGAREFARGARGFARGDRRDHRDRRRARAVRGGARRDVGRSSMDSLAPVGSMSWTVPAALYGWVAVGAALFAAFPPARAVLVAYVVGWLFLPMAELEVLGFDWSKATAVPLVVFLAVVAFDGARLARLRFIAPDLP